MRNSTIKEKHGQEAISDDVLSRALISRRRFVTGSAALGTIGLAGALTACQPRLSSNAPAEPSSNTTTTEKHSWEMPPSPIPDSDISDTIDTEIIIIGCGVAGMAAALSASELGAKVVAIEKLDSFNGHGSVEGAIGTKLQKSQGYNHDIQQCVSDFVSFCGNRVKTSLIRMWAFESGRIFDHLIELAEAEGIKVGVNGPEVHEDTGFRSQEYATAINFNDGAHHDFVALLEKKSLANGAEFHYSTTAEQLVKDDSGRVISVIAKNEDGKYVKYSASKGLILATGDYAANTEMIKAWCPKIANEAITNVYSPPVNTGDGYKMALWIGAAMQEEEPHAAMLHNLMSIGYATNPFLRVNKYGLRYENEDIPESYLTTGVLQQPDAISWNVYDANSPKYAEEQTPGFSRWSSRSMMLPFDILEWIDDGLASGLTAKANTIEELAEAMNIPKDNLVATVARYNELVAKGVDEDFFKPTNNLSPIDTPPFYASKQTLNLLCTLGGLKVSDNLEVIGNDGEVMPGLYAIGNQAGDFYANEYPVVASGISHGRCVVQGWVVVEKILGK